MLCPDKTKLTGCQSGATGATINYQQDYLRLQSETAGTINCNTRKWKNSMSSGYQSASVSGCLYSSCYSTLPQKLIDSGLSIIHETDNIPRPIWPHRNLNLHNKNNWEINFNTSDKNNPLYSCLNTKIYCRKNSALICHDCLISRSNNNKAKDILLELSSKLNSVVNGNVGLTAEEILVDLSRIIAKGIEATIGENNESKIQSHSKNNDEDNRDDTLKIEHKKLTTSNLIAKDIVNPVNHRLYEKSGHLNLYHSLSSLRHVKGDILVPRCRDICLEKGFLDDDIYLSDKQLNDDCQKKIIQKTEIQNSKIRGTSNKICYTNDEPVYTTLDPSDESSSYEIIGRSESSRHNWNEGVMVFDKNMDFTLDGVRAERLECAIARAKSRRKWCRIIITIFGLVFFLLSVIVVTMSVTRGRKIFGSM